MKDANKHPLSLYLHFPFCVRKCRYCDFLSFAADAAARQQYLNRLEEEIRLRGRIYQKHEIVSIFVGGGTPSIMTPAQICSLFETLDQSFDIAEDAEISMECNPGTVDLEKLMAMKAAGINRISFGLQSMNNTELAYLGRIHTAQDFLKSYAAAREAGFDNINIDLMSALPGQTIASYKESLEAVLALQPEHISAYSLIIEEGTPFWQLYGDDAEDETDSETGTEAQNKTENKNHVLSLPSEEDEREMYHMTGRLLEEAGYHRYEISNYAKSGRECEHNKVYWKRGDYLGLGLGAASMIGNDRFSHSRDMQAYLSSFEYEEKQTLSKEDQMEETMFLGLRLTEGVTLSHFKACFDEDMMDIYGKVIQKYKNLGLMVVSAEGKVQLTEQGMDVANPIMADFLLT